MTSDADQPRAPRRVNPVGLRTLQRNMTAHHTLLVAGGVTYSCVFGLVAAMIAVVSVYGLVAEPSDVENHVRPFVDAIPQAAGDLVIQQLESVTAINATETTLGLVLGLLGVAWAISGAVNALVMAIRIAHEAPSPHTWLQGRIFALKLSVVAVASVATMIWLVVVVPPLMDSANVGGAYRLAVSIGRWPLVLSVSMTALALLYRAAVGHRTGRYHFISWGAIVATVIWVLATIVLSYSTRSGDQLDSTLGSLGAVVALMAWIYLTVLAALIGAEIDGARFHRNGKGRDPVAG